jgi:hypothetical protein
MAQIILSTCFAWPLARADNCAGANADSVPSQAKLVLFVLKSPVFLGFFCLAWNLPFLSREQMGAVAHRLRKPSEPDNGHTFKSE